MKPKERTKTKKTKWQLFPKTINVKLVRKKTNISKVFVRYFSDSLDSQRDTGAEIAVLDSLIRNGTHLDLRAFALERLPDISLMFSTLIAVDLSYNCLTVKNI